MSLQSLGDVVAEIDLVEVDDEKVGQFSSEKQHFELAFNLLRESCQYASVVASIFKASEMTWSVREAIYGGHVVRIAKLSRFILDELVQNRSELISVLNRLLAEAVINLRFLIESDSDSVIRSYLYQSLQHENELVDYINERIAERGGELLPIEKRMLSSITRVFENSEVAPEEVPKRRIRNWGNKNLFEKAKSVGLEDAYSAIFSGPSRNVHGGWQDLLSHHLDCQKPGQFKPRFEFTRPRPQSIFVLNYLTVSALMAYVLKFGFSEEASLGNRLTELAQRIDRADDLHEEYLGARAA